MCTGAELALAAQAASATAAVAGTASSIEASRDAKKDRAAATAERVKAESDAAASASGKVAMQRQALRKNSLYTGAGTPGAAPDAGRTTLGV